MFVLACTIIALSAASAGAEESTGGHVCQREVKTQQPCPVRFDFLNEWGKGDQEDRVDIDLLRTGMGLKYARQVQDEIEKRQSLNVPCPYTR
jgi:hypothetical protein